MRAMRIGGSVAALAILLLVAGLWFSHSAFAAVDQPKKLLHVNWVVAHEPASLFGPAQQKFVDVFNENSKDARIEVSPFGPSDFGEDRLIAPFVLQKLDSGQMQIASISVGGLRNNAPLLNTLTLPFLLKNYDTATGVLEGPEGQQLLSSVHETTKVRGLAFTYSGGLEMIITKSKEIHSPEDMKGLRIATSLGGIAEDTLRAFGAIPVRYNSLISPQELGALVDSNDVDGIEFTYTRLKLITDNAKSHLIVNETFHNFYLTTMIVSDAFYDSLSSADQDALRKAAFEAARVERADSIALAQQRREEFAAKGLKIVALTDAQRQGFKDLVQGVYQKYAPVLGQDFVDKILDEQ